MKWGEFISMCELGRWRNHVRQGMHAVFCTTERGEVKIYTAWNPNREVTQVRINGQRKLDTLELRRILAVKLNSEEDLGHA